MFLIKTFVFANASDSKIRNGDTSHYAKKRRQSTRHNIGYAQTLNGFLSAINLNFISGTKYGDHHDFMKAEILNTGCSQLLPYVQQPSLITMDNASYHNAACLHEKRILFAQRSSKAELLNLPTPKSLCRRHGNHMHSLNSEYIVW